MVDAESEQADGSESGASTPYSGLRGRVEIVFSALTHHDHAC